ncbi:MAG: DNA repair protein RecN [Acidobacteria bacterium]|nr:DNA repair protein RecN [Acidobacteriota bacterium]
MLRLLRIQDFALIRELETEFGPGLNMLTGETGSGKSIIVDALGLLVGERTSVEAVRSGSDSAVVEGVFSAEANGDLLAVLEDAGIEAEESLIIRREISSSGRSRALVNNRLATLTLVRSLGERLADIHGQQEHHALLDLGTHLDWLDRYGANQERLSQVRIHHEKLKELERHLTALQGDELERRRRLDILRFQLDEIRSAGLKAEEKEELERERRLLANRARIFSLASEAYALVYESDSALVAMTRRLIRIIQELERIDAEWSAARQHMEERAFQLEDLAVTLRGYTGEAEFSPEMLDRVERRLAEIERLTGKYGRTVPEVLEFAARCEREAGELTSFEETSEGLEKQMEAEFRAYADAAGALSLKRRKDAPALVQALDREFQSLALEKMRLEVRFQDHDGAAREKGKIPPWCRAAGLDRVEFLVAPNVGEEMKPLARIASGGELSRVMLAIKVVCGGDPDKTLVFDEVDSGIGGRIADAVGRRLRGVSERGQVLCVTHLPQIAAFAHRHYCVSKRVVGSRTLTSVRLLTETERVEELARMLGGRVISEATRRHAEEMLDQASQADPRRHARKR